jgi:hypothetical protein
MIAPYEVRDSPLTLGDRIYQTSFIVLEGHGIDVILNISWMKLHGAVLHIASNTVQLQSPTRGLYHLNLKFPKPSKPVVYHKDGNKLEEICNTLCYENPN